MPEPITPGEVHDLDVDDLTNAYQLRRRLMAGLEREQAGRIALSVLAFGARITEVLRAQSWPVAVVALDAGESHEQVAAAMDLGPGELAEGLLGWADEQLQADLLTDVQHAEVLSLAGYPTTEGSDPR